MPIRFVSSIMKSVGMWRATNAGGAHDVVDDYLRCWIRHLSVNVVNEVKHRHIHTCSRQCLTVAQFVFLTATISDKIKM